MHCTGSNKPQTIVLCCCFIHAGAIPSFLQFSTVQAKFWNLVVLDHGSWIGLPFHENDKRGGYN